MVPAAKPETLAGGLVGGGEGAEELGMVMVA